MFEVGDPPVCGGELVFEADDASGGYQGHVLIEQFAHPGSEGEFRAAIATLAAGGPVRGQQPGRVEAAQESGLHAEQVRGSPHGVCRVVSVVEFVRGALGSYHLVSGREEGPGSHGKNSCPGPSV